MLEANDDLMSIVVLEAGATWPVWLTEYQRIAPNAVVVAQDAAEPAEAFAGRVVHRIEDAISKDAKRVRVGVLVAAPSRDDGRVAMRERVARVILKALGSQKDAELVLAGDGGEGDPSRQELFTLAGALCQELAGSNLNVRVRFSGKSGVMRSVIASATDGDTLVNKGHG
jgi:hypothetical protein